MNPLFRAQLACFLAVLPLGAFILGILAATALLLHYVLPGAQTDLEPGIRWLAYIGVLLGAPFVSGWAAWETAFLARIAPLSRRRRLLGQLEWMGTAALAAGLLAAAAGPGQVDFTFHGLLVDAWNLALTVLAGTLAFAILWAVAEGWRWYVRLPCLLVLMALYCALGAIEGFSPARPALSLFLLPVLLFLLDSYRRLEPALEILPEGVTGPPAVARTSRPPERTPGRLQEARRPARTPRLSGRALRSLGRHPAWTLLACSGGWDRALTAFLFVVALPQALLPPFAGFLLMPFFFASMPISHALGKAWAPFLATPFPRRRAFVTLVAPVLMLWFVWSLVHLTAMLAYGESCVTWAVSTGAGTGEIRLSLPMPRDKRRLDVEKELGTLDLAGDPQAIARWVCRYLEETYGARRDPASLLELGDAGFSLENDPGARRLWLRRIEAVLGGEASRKSLRRHAVDTLLALCVMLLMAFTFTWAFSNSGRALLLVAAASLLAYSAVWLLVFVPFFWDKVRSFLDALPLAPAALALLATLLLLRHYRAFRHLTLDVPAMRPVRNIRRPRPALSR